MLTGFKRARVPHLAVAALGATLALTGAPRAHAQDAVTACPGDCAELIGVFTKGSSEIHVNLGSPSSLATFGGFTPAQLSAAGFGNDLTGASFAVVGTQDATAKVFVNGDFGAEPIDFPNILFTGDADPNTVPDAPLTVGFANLQSFLSSRRAALPTPGSFSPISSADPSSFFNKFGPNGTGGGNLPSTNVRLRRHGRSTPLPVFFVSPTVEGSSDANGNPVPVLHNARVDAALKIGPNGSIERFTQADFDTIINKTQAFAVFTDGTRNLIVNLGDHDDLAAGSGVNVASSLPAEWAGTLAGTQLAAVGFFDQDAGFANVLLSAPSGVPNLSGSQIDAAFNQSAAYFLNGIPSIPAVGGTIVAAGTFESSFGGCTAASMVPASICAPVTTSGATVDVGGHENNPNPTIGVNNLPVLRLTVTAAGQITASSLLP